MSIVAFDELIRPWIMTETEFSLSPDLWRLVDVAVEMRRSLWWRTVDRSGSTCRGEVRRGDAVLFADAAHGACP